MTAIKNNTIFLLTFLCISAGLRGMEEISKETPIAAEPVAVFTAMPVVEKWDDRIVLAKEPELPPTIVASAFLRILNESQKSGEKTTGLIKENLSDDQVKELAAKIIATEGRFCPKCDKSIGKTDKLASSHAQRHSTSQQYICMGSSDKPCFTLFSDKNDLIGHHERVHKIKKGTYYYERNKERQLENGLYEWGLRGFSSSTQQAKKKQKTTENY